MIFKVWMSSAEGSALDDFHGIPLILSRFEARQGTNQVCVQEWRENHKTTVVAINNCDPEPAIPTGNRPTSRPERSGRKRISHLSEHQSYGNCIGACSQVPAR